MQDTGDSQDMLKRPDAASLKDTGRFYLQVGYNEYFALGQSAWCGADYIPQDEVIQQKDESVQLIVIQHRLFWQQSQSRKKRMPKANKSLP